MLPVDRLVLGVLEDRFPPHPNLPAAVDGIIVLGGSIDPTLSARRGMPIIRGAADRITAMVVLARRHPEARVIFTGGSGDPLAPDDREAPQVKALLTAMGVDTGAVTFEEHSRNTRENALYSKELMRPQPGETWVLVTSAMHMPRAVGAFRAVGWPVVAYPVDYATDGGGSISGVLRFNVTAGLGGLQAVAHEMLGLAWYRLQGWSDRLWPAP